jgi:hypothetical protein
MPKLPTLHGFLLLALCSGIATSAKTLADGGASSERPRMTATCIPQQEAEAELAKPPQGVSVTDTGPLGSDNKIHTGAADWDSSICVHVANLQQWIASGNDAGKLVLYLDGRGLDDPKIGPEVHREGNDLVYRLIRTESTKEQWKALLGNPCNPKCTVRSFRVSVGLKEGPPFASSAPRLQVNVISVRSPGVVLAIIAFVGLVVLVWSKRLRAYLKDLLRETQTDTPPGPFSLGRVQMMFWLFLVIAAYLAIYGLTGYYDTLSGSVLTLIGISGGTSLLGVVVDSNSRDQARKSLQDTIDQIAVLQALPAPLSAADQKKLADLQKDRPRLDAIVNPKASGNFLTDVLSYRGTDDTGVHRFQIALWTLILGAIFVIEVFRTLAMPDFSAGLLGLMGISSGTYLGFKVATQKPTQP